MIEYRSISKNVSVETEIRKSLFITYLTKITSLEDAAVQLGQIRKIHHKATHHCFAYSVGIETGNLSVKFSDDGEPSGTAGKPILSVIEHNGLQNVLIVVVRYFGGIKLGAGGLTRAYSQCAAEAVAQANIVRMILCVLTEFETDYSFYGRLQPYLEESNCKITEQTFSDQVKLTVLIPKNLVEQIISQVKELSNGACTGRILGESYTEYI